jgi:hypothetical protein
LGHLTAEAIANRILESDRDLAVRALANLVKEELDGFYLAFLAKRELRKRPGCASRLGEARAIASTLDVPLWYVLRLEESRWEGVIACAEVVAILRRDGKEARRAFTREAILTSEHLAPIRDELTEDMEPHEVIRRLKAATDRIIQEMETSSGTTEDHK